MELPCPLNAKGVQVFMGHCGYYRRFIYMYAEVARPLYALLIVFEWSEDCEQAFKKLMNALISAPILKSPDWILMHQLMPLDAFWHSRTKTTWIFLFVMQADNLTVLKRIIQQLRERD